MTNIITYDKLNHTINVYGKDKHWFMATDLPNEIGHMRSYPLWDKKAVYIYRNALNEIHAAIGKYGMSLTSQIKKKWKYTNPYWR